MKRTIWLAAPLTLFLAACGDTDTAPTADEVSRLATQNLDALSSELASLTRQLLDSPLLRDALRLDDCDGPSPAPSGGGWGGDGWEDEPWDDDSWDFCSGDSPDEILLEGSEWLASRLFDQRNHETTNGATTTFRLRGEVLCDAEDGGDCREFFSQIAIRLHVTRPAPSTLEIAVDVDGARPLTLVLGPSFLRTAFDLGEIHAALSSLQDDDDLPEQMQGKVELALSLRGEAKADFEISVTEKIAVTNSDTDFSFLMERAAPALRISADGPSRHLSAHVTLGAIEFSAPSVDDLEDCSWESDMVNCVTHAGLDGIFTYRTGGVTAKATLDTWGEGEGFSLENLKIATASASLDGAPLMSLNLGGGEGGGIDVTISREGDDMKVEVSPSLELALTFQLANVQDRLEDIPAWALDEELKIRLDGSERPALRFFGEQEAGNLLEVLSGTLTLESKAYSVISVSSGMCLHGSGAEDAVEEGDGLLDSTHPFEGFSGGSCGDE